MAWKIDGTYFENCSCDWVCPCTYSSIEGAPIEYRDAGLTHSVRIGDGIEIEVEDFVGHEGLEPTRLVNVFHPSSTTLTIAKPTSSRIRAFGMEFQNEGRSAFSAPFSWAG